MAEVEPLLGRTTWPHYLTGTITLEAGGQKLFYEQPGVETDAGWLEFLFDFLSDLLTAYPALMALGGEVIPRLQAISVDETHLLRPVAPHLIRDIAQATTRRWGHTASRLICTRCLGRCVARQTSSSSTVTYYACHACDQSQQFFKMSG